MSVSNKPKVIAIITEEAPYQASYRQMLLRLFAQTPLHGAIRTALPGLVKAYKNWAYAERKRDPEYIRHIEKHNGYWLIFRDVRVARKYFQIDPKTLDESVQRRRL